MKKILLWIVIVLVASAHAATTDSGNSLPAELKPQQQQAQAAFLATTLLTRYHYKAMPLDNSMSEKIFDHYLKSLDSDKQFFVQSDIDQLAAFRVTLDDAIIDEDLTAPFAIFRLFTQRVSERFAYARSLLKDGFDFRKKETYRYEREKAAWSKSEDEMRDLWQKRVKSDWLRLKLAGKNDKSIRETLDNRYDNSLKRISRTKSEDAFQSFMNAYTTAIEPHTNYMGLRAAEDFDISMRLSLVGIGAVLTEKDEYTTIRELVPGGPAALSGQLKVGDRILGVAQSENGIVTDVLGWRLDDTVRLIRGKADTVVLLDVLPAEAGPDGKHQRVSLVRKKISLEEQAAKKSILPVIDGETTHRIGVITLPSFYTDFEARRKGDPNYKSATHDVTRLLGELKEEKVDGVLIDLRNNGGGSLSEAIEFTGLFVGNGPVVQQRDAQGKVSVERNTNASIAWDGPLSVLINRGSASASEIFAAAIQDYGRGLVIGEGSFGKGTVQTLISLDQIAKNDKPQFGELKITVAQFFRINGGTTQLRGVKPDILFPSISDEESFGESSFDNALPWVQIKAADYSPTGDLKSLVPTLLARHDARVKKDKDFQYLQEDIAEIKRQRKTKLVSLNEVERRQERDAQEARLKTREAQRVDPNSGRKGVAALESTPVKGSTLRDDGLQSDERTLVGELEAEKARKNAKDVMLNEAVNVLSDKVGLLKMSASLTTAAKPAAPRIADHPQALGTVH